MSLRTSTSASAASASAAASSGEEWTRVTHAKVPRNNPFARRSVRPAFAEPTPSPATAPPTAAAARRQFSFAAASVAARLEEDDDDHDDSSAVPAPAPAPAASAAPTTRGTYVPPFKRTAAEAKPAAKAQSYDEAFPSLGGAAAAAAKPRTATAAAGTKSFATLVRERAEKDAIEEEHRKLAALRASYQNAQLERERALYRNVGRVSTGYNPDNYMSKEDDAHDGYDDDSLDYDAYGQRISSYNPSNYGDFTDDRDDREHQSGSYDDDDDY